MANFRLSFDEEQLVKTCGILGNIIMLILMLNELQGNRQGYRCHKRDPKLTMELKWYQ